MVVKRVDLIRSLLRHAKESGTTVELVRHAAGHEVWRFGTAMVTVPRHQEIDERTAQGIIRTATEGSTE